MDTPPRAGNSDRRSWGPTPDRSHMGPVSASSAISRACAHARVAARRAAPVSPLAQAAGGGPRFGCEGFDLLNPCRRALWHGLNTTPGTRANLRAIPRVHDARTAPRPSRGPSHAHRFDHVRGFWRDRTE